MFLKFKKSKKYVSYIPKKVIKKEEEVTGKMSKKYILCGNWCGYYFEYVSSVPFLVFEWVVEGPNGFSFSTYHRLDFQLLDFLEESRAIKRINGKVDLNLMGNYEYELHFKRSKKKEYILEKILVQDSSYWLNIKAFYQPIQVINELHTEANTFLEKSTNADYTDKDYWNYLLEMAQDEK